MSHPHDATPRQILDREVEWYCQANPQRVPRSQEWLDFSEPYLPFCQTWRACWVAEFVLREWSRYLSSRPGDYVAPTCVPRAWDFRGAVDDIEPRPASTFAVLSNATGETRPRQEKQAMTTTETNEAHRYAQGIAEGLHDLNAALEVYEGNDDLDPLSTWLDDALEIIVLTGSSISRVEVVVTVGGPHAVVVRDSRDGECVEVVVTWWGESATVRAWVPRVAEQLDEIGQAY